MNYKLFVSIIFTITSLIAQAEIAQDVLPRSSARESAIATQDADYNACLALLHECNNTTSGSDSLNTHSPESHSPTDAIPRNYNSEKDHSLHGAANAVTPSAHARLASYVNLCSDRRLAIGTLATTAAVFFARRLMTTIQPKLNNEAALKTMEAVMQPNESTEANLDKTISLLEKLKNIIKKMTDVVCQAEELISKVNSVIDKLIIIRKLLF